MRKLILVAPLLVVAASFVIIAAVQGPTPAADATYDDTAVLVVEDVEFTGAAKCKTCHRKPESGEQYPKWEEGPHSKAFMTLASDEAKAIAAERGIDNPQESAECLQCHVTAYDAPAELLGAKYSVEEGVGCESCHGAGGNYYKKSTMKSITAGEIEGSSVGLVTPSEATCTGCHNENSPTFKGFDFEEYSAKIAHPIPEETKAAYK
ncbi:MAG: cytochrome c family protein [Rhodothermia bacterium]|nr:cytochrome c family protein [Rhodothermia bacterium]